jgi:hypothetical protein
LYAFLIAHMSSTYPAHLILLDLFVLIIFVKLANYKARHYTIFSSLLPLHPP